MGTPTLLCIALQMSAAAAACTTVSVTAAATATILVLALVLMALVFFTIAAVFSIVLAPITINNNHHVIYFYLIYYAEMDGMEEVKCYGSLLTLCAYYCSQVELLLKSGASGILLVLASRCTGGFQVYKILVS